jgi:hypothetical protein
MGIRFTRHAREKFAILARHNFVVSEAQVIETLNSPDRVETDRDPPVAQKGLDAEHVLRVAFRVEGGDQVVITFYPGRRRQYES